MSKNNPLILAGLPLSELLRIREELSLANRSLKHDQKMMAVRFEAINEAIRQTEASEEDLLISDHAIVRWLERIDGIDLEPIRQKIRAIASGKFDPKETHTVVVDEDQGAVVVMRGRRTDLKEVLPAMVVTILDTNGPIPEKGQLSVMKGLEEA